MRRHDSPLALLARIAGAAPHRALVSRLRTFLWNQAQHPDVDLIHDRLGLFGVSSYLKTCPFPDRINDVLRRYGADIDPQAWPIGPNITIHEAVEDYANLSVGPDAHIGKEAFLDLTDRIVIEGGVAVGMRAVILTHLNVGEGYRHKPTQFLFPSKKRPTILRRGCSVGAGAVILCGVEIGEDSVINAGVVVDRDVPPGTIVTSSRNKPDYRMPERLLERCRAANG
jgi:UDP-2-acetamido-3-amino-2,3-dideoxy-glucuronate N-acetyltransferase